jgi:nucleoside 2-deoxyribosyltransferase
MKFYLAASWKTRPRMRQHARELAEMGHEVTSTWIANEASEGMKAADIAAQPARALRGAYADMAQIRAADTVVVFSEIPSTTGGLHWEAGYATGLNKPVVLIGDPPNVFFVLPSYGRFKTWEEFKVWLKDNTV